MAKTVTGEEQILLKMNYSIYGILSCCKKTEIILAVDIS